MGRISLMRRPPKYCHLKHGRRKDGPGFWYFERPGYARVRLPGLCWSPPFMAAYEAAMAGSPAVTEKKPPAEPGTMHDLVIRYQSSAAFLGECKASTQEKYRRVLDRIRAEDGKRPVKGLQREHVFAKLQKFADTPSQGNLWLKVTSNLMKHAVNLGMRKDNPCHGVKKLKEKGKETTPWTPEQRAAYEQHWPIGTMQRLAYALLLWTSRRLSDVRLLGPQHAKVIEGEPCIVFGQIKTGAPHASPIPAPLAEAIEKTKAGHLVYVTTERGSGFASDKSFGNFLAKAIAATGIEGVTAHGLRATLPTDAAEVGATEKELQGLTGHRQTAMVAKYTSKANQRRLASNALAKIASIGNGARTKS